MNISTIVGVVGVLGFVLSVVVFILTRWERRCRLEIELFRGDLDRIDPDFLDSEEEPGTIIGIRVVNIGVRAVVVNRSSFTLIGNNKTISVHDTDWVGLDRIPAPLPPNGSFEVGVFADYFDEALGADEFADYMNVEDYKKCIVGITATFEDADGKRFSSKDKYRYSFYVSEFWPAQHVGS